MTLYRVSRTTDEVEVLGQGWRRLKGSIEEILPEDTGEDVFRAQDLGHDREFWYLVTAEP